MERRKSETNVNNSRGGSENDTLVLVDRISSLPDSILGVVLSFLPTENALATSILSKRWQFMWRSVNNLDFSHEVCAGKEDKDETMRFVRFVNGVLLHHDAGLLNKFRLVWEPMCIASHATSWINTAITRNVHELCVCVETICFKLLCGESFVMPISVFSCKSLRTLDLDGCISVPAATVVCLPRLESLKLVSVLFQSEEAFKKLISGCSMLNYLHLHMTDNIFYDCRAPPDFKYIISSTSLRRLELCIDCERVGSRFTTEDFHRFVELEASSLQYLKLDGGFIPNFVLRKSLSSLIEGEFRIIMLEHAFSNASICNSIVEAVCAFHCAKVLTLSTDVMLAFSCATINLPTEFKRLERLKLAGSYCCECSSLRDFIQSSDNLEVLAIHQYPNFLMRMHDDSKWRAPVEVPRYLSNSLKKVVVKDYYGNEDEREMMRYMLKHGSNLEVLEISCHRDKNIAEFELFQEICEFPKKSMACEVKLFRVDIKGREHQSAVTTATARSNSNGVS